MTSFDELLARSAPQLPDSAELDRELGLLVAEAERSTTRSRTRRLRLGAVGLAAVGVLGLGGAAAAGNLPWFESASSRDVVTTSTGTECEVTFGAKGLVDPGHPVDDSTRAATLTAAHAFLEDLDVSGIDLETAVRDAPPRTVVDSEAGPAQSVDEHETSALMTAVQERLDAELVRQGLPVEAVSLSMATTCGDSE